MSYPEKLSEHGAITSGALWTSFNDTTKTLTLTTIDMRDYHRVRPIFFVAVTSTTSATTAQTATASAKATIQSIKIVASDSSAFGGTSTTVTSSTSSSTISSTSAIGSSTKTTVTTTATKWRTMEVDGEQVQSKRNTDMDRYIKAKIKVRAPTTSDKVRVTGCYQKAVSRYDPA
jgi:hypothetical protein